MYSNKNYQSLGSYYNSILPIFFTMNKNYNHLIFTSNEKFFVVYPVFFKRIYFFLLYGIRLKSRKLSNFFFLNKHFIFECTLSSIKFRIFSPVPYSMFIVG